MLSSETLTDASSASQRSAEFYYVCGVQWEDCGCEQWDESRLINRANDIVDRDPDAEGLNEVARAAIVDQERRNLVDKSPVCARVLEVP